MVRICFLIASIAAGTSGLLFVADSEFLPVVMAGCASMALLVASRLYPVIGED
jgi:hypothetical protein